MTIRAYALGELQANCYLLEHNNQCIIIDPADEAAFILEILARENLELVALLATHGHSDHIMAVGEIQLSFDVPFYIHKKDLFLLDRLKQTAKHFLGYQPTIIKPKNIIHYSSSHFKFFTLNFELIFTPGHTPGSCCFYLNELCHPELACPPKPWRRRSSGSPIIFSGDTLFKQGIGRYDFSYSSKPDLDESLKKLFKLHPKTRVYPGHGEQTTIEEEKRNIILT